MDRPPGQVSVAIVEHNLGLVLAECKKILWL